MSRAALLFVSTLLSTGCGKPPQVTGTVTDIFGLPLVGATVAMEGVPEQATTDAEGKYALPAQKAVMRIRAGKDGYIADLESVDPLPEGEKKKKELPAPALKLIPEPDHVGFFMVADRYLELPKEPIVVVGTELKSVAGIKDPGKVRVGSKDSQLLVFKSGLRRSEISQINLQLHELGFIEETDAKGVFGEEPVRLNLWVAGGRKGFELEGTTAEDVYILKTDKLDPGVYAFHTQDMLTQDEVAALDKLPKEQRVAYLFEVK